MEDKQLIELVTAVCVILGGISTVTVVVVKAVIGVRKSVDEINDAVNHRHEKTGKKDAPKLYDLMHANANHMESMLMSMGMLREDVKELVEWRRSYHGGPWETGEGVNRWLEEHKDCYQRMLERIEKVECCDQCPTKQHNDLSTNNN